jgi:hypothetical protein
MQAGSWVLDPTVNQSEIPAAPVNSRHLPFTAPFTSGKTMKEGFCPQKKFHSNLYWTEQ